MEFFRWTWVFMIICLMNNSTQGRITSRELSDVTIKTIQSEDGDVIHCIDIYKQPAFNHPLLENHTIEMVPSFYSEETNRSSKEKIFQTWQKNGSCPNGTISVLNIRSKQENSTFMSLNVLNGQGRLETAGYFASGGSYAGVKGRFLVCSPALVERNEYTSAGVVLQFRTTHVQLGWMVHPHYFGDHASRLYVIWSSAQQQGVDVINLELPGFVHTSRNVALGASLIHDNNNILRQFKLQRGNSGRKWWAFLDDEPIGYWPDELIYDLRTAQTVGWSGMAFNSQPGSPHTSTQMGNGVHPVLGASTSYGSGPAAAFVDDMGVLSSSSVDFSVPQNSMSIISFPRCYSAVLMQQGRSNINVGMTMYFGGTGRPGCDVGDH